MSVRVHESLEGLMTEIEDAVDLVVRRKLWCPALGIWYSGTEESCRAATAELWARYFPLLSDEVRAAPSIEASLAFFGRVLEELQATLRNAEPILATV